MRIILLGAPGSGKGTQARFLTEKYKIPQISTGDMLRSAINMHSEIGTKIQNCMNKGKLVYDELICALVEQRIAQHDCNHGFILDGFPRTISQAKRLKTSGILIDFVLEFYVPDQLIIDRIIGRQIHIPSGRIYHVKFNPPKRDGIDDITGDYLSIRNDDYKSTLYNRITEYHQKTKILIDFYRKEAEIDNLSYFSIDGTHSILDINNQLINLLSAHGTSN